MFKTRLLSGIVLVLIALATIIPGGIVLFATLVAISMIGMQELYKAMKVQENGVGSLELVGYAGAVIYYLTLLFEKEEFSLIAVLFALVLIMSVYVFTYPKYHADQIMAAMFGVLYVAVMLSYIYKTRNLEGGAWLVGTYLFKFLGQRHLCLLRGNADRKAQDGSCAESEKIGGRRRGRCPGSSPAGCSLRGGDRKVESCFRPYSAYVRPDLCCGCSDLHGWGFGGICDQEKQRDKGLRQTDPGTRRYSGPF